MRLLFTIATFVGSLALFLIEPMVAKALLPSFGGSSLVWNVSLLFFQAALLGGYAYANTLTNRAKPKAAAPIHLGIIAVSLALTAALLVPAGLWKVHPAPEATPIWQLLLTLTLTTAAPFVVLAAGTPLIQRWFAHSNDPHAHDPYFLYAASNLGSFCGLIAYPVLVEPRLTLIQQRILVLVLFAIYGGLLARAAQLVRAFTTTAENDRDPAVEAAPVTPSQKAKWAALSAAPSALLLAVTTDLTKNIAPIPLLWIAPLGLYLLTFVIVFSNRARKMEQAGGAPLALKIFLAVAVGCGAALFVGNNLKIQVAVSCSLISFFGAVFACHLQLARLRPAASQLTTYYLWVSIGGVLGGLFCAIFAPIAFTGLWELPIAYGACILLYAFIQPRKRFTPLDLVVPVVLSVGIFLFGSYCNRNGWAPPQVAECMGVVFLVACNWPIRFALTYAGFLLTFGFITKIPSSSILYSARNFYGYETVTVEGDQTHRLVNGTILHGAQFIDPVLAREPTTYYSKHGPLGMALQPMIQARPNSRIGAVGLGTGTEAAYGEPGMSIDFYELNPEIKRIATDRRLFTYVPDSKAKVQIILGDARLSIVSAPDRSYDAIILDAFSSDSIPVHLLTQQAFELYETKLKPDGILLVHTSNRYLRLSDVVAATGKAVGLACDLAEDNPDINSIERWSTTWLCLAANRSRLTEIEGPKSLWKPFSSPNTAAWTDDYSNVFGALRPPN